MSLTESVRIALRALMANKLRAVLTMLGIVIGVAAVITLLSVGKGVEQMVQESFEGLGSNLLYVFPGSMESLTASTKRAEITTGDYRAIADPFAVPGTLGVAPELGSRANVIHGKRGIRADVSGVTPEYVQVRNLVVGEGSFFSEADVTGRSRVAVLGYQVYESLFDEGAYAVGQTIKINSVPFRVIAVLEEKGDSHYGGADSMVFVPLATAQARLYPWRSSKGDPLLSTIYVQVADKEWMDEVADTVAQVLRVRHGIAFRDEDDFTVLKQTDILSIAGDITGVLTIFLGAIAAISLLVGGIGIMNIMLVSVTERTREIGIRKAVGAKSRDIRVQFMVEAMALSLLGGLIGLALGLTGSRIVAGLAENLTTVVTWDTVALAVGFSAAVGLFFGLYPASRAAALNPIDALRYE